MWGKRRRQDRRGVSSASKKSSSSSSFFFSSSSSSSSSLTAARTTTRFDRFLFLVVVGIGFVIGLNCLSSVTHSSIVSGMATRPKPSSKNKNNNNDNNNKNVRNVVVVGGGIQGCSVAYHIAKKSSSSVSDGRKVKIVVLEAKSVASAASGKGGGFMARSWGNGSPTQSLHEVSFDMYEELARELQCSSYRKLPVLSISAGYPGGIDTMKRSQPETIGKLIPNWLDGNEYGRISVLGYGDDTAQITPNEFVWNMLQQESDRIQVVLGTCTGILTEPIMNNDDDDDDDDDDDNDRKVVGVQYRPRCNTQEEEEQEQQQQQQQQQQDEILPADDVIISAGPWSCQAEDWFDGIISLPMEGIKSTSIVWKKPSVDENTTTTNNNNQQVVVDGTALFCGEDDRFQTHLEVYPRPNGEIYICGIGGSDYISTLELKQGAFLENCFAKETRVQAAVQSFQQMSSMYQEQTNMELDRTQACMRPCPPDALPYMGKIPYYRGAYINAGHNCWGIAWAPGCGKAMSELVLDGTSTTINLRPFDPTRFTKKITKPSSRSSKNRGRKRGSTNVGEQW